MRKEFIDYIKTFKLDDEDIIEDTQLATNLLRELRCALKNYYWPKGRVLPTVRKQTIKVGENEICIGYNFNGVIMPFNPLKYFERIEHMLPVADGHYYVEEESRNEGTLVFTKFVSKGVSDIATLVEFVKQKSETVNVNMVHLNFLTGAGKVRRSFKNGRLESGIDYYEDDSIVKHGSDSEMVDNKFSVDTEEFEISYNNDSVVAGGSRTVPNEKYPHLVIKDYFDPKGMLSCAYAVVWHYFKKVLKLQPPVSLIHLKKQFGLHEEANMHQIRTFCTYLGLTVNFISDVSHNYEEGALNMLFDKAHAYYVAGVTTKTKPKVSKDKSPFLLPFDVYVGIDFETITDEHDEAVPYAFSFAATGTIDNYDFSPESGREVSMDVFDPNTTSFCASVKYGMGEKCLTDFNKFVYTAKRKNWHLLIYGFNNAKFDNMLLLKYFKRYRKDREYTIFRDVQVTNNQYRSMKIFNHKVHDLLYMLSPASLAAHTKNFQCKPTKLDSTSFTHADIQQMYDDAPDKFLESLKSVTDMTLYSKNDVVCLLSLMSRYKEGVNGMLEKLGSPSFSFKSSPHTAGSLAWKTFCETVPDYKLEALPEELDKIVRANMVGGRTCLFKFKDHKLAEMKEDGIEVRFNSKKQVHIKASKDLITYSDYCSLYATVMFCQEHTETIMGPQYKLWPTSNRYERIVGNTVVDGAAIYRCSIDQSNLFHPLICPAASDGDISHDWDSVAFIASKWITHDEYNVLIEYGCKVHIYEAIKFLDSSKDLWDKYISCTFLTKKEQDLLKANKKPYNPSLRELAKLMLTSASGKPSQRNFESSSEFVSSDLQKAEFIKKHKFGTLDFINIREDVCIATGDKEKVFDEDKAYPSYLSMFIYGKARTLMYKTMINPMGLDIQPIYSDTDSMILSARDLKKVKEKFPLLFFEKAVDKHLGKLDVEHDDISELWLFNKKDYAYVCGDQLTLKLKGVRAQNGDGSLVDMWIRPVKDETFEEVPVDVSNLPDILKLGVYVISKDHKLYANMKYDGSLFQLFRVKTHDNVITVTEARYSASLQKMDVDGLNFRYRAECVNLNVFTVKKHWRNSTITYSNVTKAIK